MKTVNINQKLSDIGIIVSDISLGEFDYFGEFTAKRQRDQGNKNFKDGAFYRSNYERGLLIYNIIRQYDLKSYLEIGFGRGYSMLCAKKAFYDSGIDGRVVTIDPVLAKEWLEGLTTVIPQQYMKDVEYCKGKSSEVLPKLGDAKFDFVYIDGDHSYDGTKLDWELVKDKASKFVLFDDYHLLSKTDPGIQCQKAIDEINWDQEGFVEPELIICDRQIFLDDRARDSNFRQDLDYGMVLTNRIGVTRDGW